MRASRLLIQGKSRMRKRACTDLCGGRSAMVVPTATTEVSISTMLLKLPNRAYSSRPDSSFRTRAHWEAAAPALAAMVPTNCCFKRDENHLAGD